MLGKPIRLGRLFGIDLTISWSFLVLVVGLSLYMAFRSSNFLLGLLTGTISLALVFASVLAHELGHSLVARRLGVRIQEIELHFFGGAAKMLDAPKSPREEIWIAAAGPAVSFILAGAFWGLTTVGVAIGGVVGALASVNLILGAFNLIPALPTDGGRILRSVLALKLGTLQATRIAVKVARVATLGVGIVGLFTGQFFLLAIAVFLWVLGTRELAMAEGESRNDAKYWFDGARSPEPKEARVEVFDQFGHFLGTAPGGGVESTTSSPSMPRPHTVLRYDAWSGIDEPTRGAKRAGRNALVRGPDGRLWVVTQRGYSSA